jgi:NADH dehydrogenase
MAGPAVQAGAWVARDLLARPRGQRIQPFRFIPDTENRIALFSKWMWQIATRQRTPLLITGRPDQHLGVDVGLFRAPRPSA